MASFRRRVFIILTILFAILLTAIILLSQSAPWSQNGHDSDRSVQRSYRKWSGSSKHRTKRLLDPEPAANGFSTAYKPPDNYNSFPDDVLTRGHPVTRQRIYPSIARNDSCHNCLPYIFHNVISPKPCTTIQSLKLLVLVTTAPGEVALRGVIRDTWGRTTGISRTIFLLGVGWTEHEQKLIAHESQAYGDVLQDNYIDSYLNLSLKMLSGYHWWSKHCGSTPYILRTATDNYVNIKTLLPLLDTKPFEEENKILGYCSDVHPYVMCRNVSEKLYVHPMEYRHPKPPPFCIGTAFITNAVTTKLIIKTSPNVPYFVHEDVYFGLVMDQAAKINNFTDTTHSIEGFNIQLSEEMLMDLKMGKCPFGSKWVSVHLVESAEVMRLIDESCAGFRL